MIPLPASVKAWLVPILVGGSAALLALGKLDPPWAWATGVGGILLYLDGLITVPGTAAQKAAHAAAAP